MTTRTQRPGEVDGTLSLNFNMAGEFENLFVMDQMLEICRYVGASAGLFAWLTYIQ